MIKQKVKVIIDLEARPNPVQLRNGQQLYKTVAVALVLISYVLANAHLSFSATACNYYASPTGTGDGLSVSSPFKINKFWSVAMPGKTLCLLDGTYTGRESMIEPPGGFSGEAGKPITVRALNDGKAFIDGQKSYIPVHLYQNRYFSLEGFNAANSKADVIQISGPMGGTSGSDFTTIRRVVAWNAAINQNAKVFQVTSSRGVLIEDSAGFGTGRKIFEPYRSDSVTLRRIWARWEGSTYSGPKMAVSSTYRSYGTLLENVIATWTGESQPAGTTPDQISGVIAMDRLEANDDPWQYPGRGFNSFVKILGSIGYINGGANYVPLAPIRQFKIKNMTLNNVVGYMQPGGFYNKNTIVLTNCFEICPPPGTDLIASKLTGIGGNGSMQLGSEWTVTSIKQGATLTAVPSIYNSSLGAQVCRRYVNGVLTSTPLWPWPMNQRIMDAMVRAGKKPVDVTQTIEQMFGPIPSECRTDSAIPVTQTAPSNLRIVGVN